MLGEWLGEGSKTTETFVTETDRWEMEWKVLCDDKSVGTFLEVNVTKPGENTPAWTLSYFGGYNEGKWHGQNIQVQIPPGEYYLEITSENIRWEIVVKEPGGSR